MQAVQRLLPVFLLMTKRCEVQASMGYILGRMAWPWLDWPMVSGPMNATECWMHSSPHSRVARAASRMAAAYSLAWSVCMRMAAELAASAWVCAMMALVYSCRAAEWACACRVMEWVMPSMQGCCMASLTTCIPCRQACV